MTKGQFPFSAEIRRVRKRPLCLFLFDFSFDDNGSHICYCGTCRIHAIISFFSLEQQTKNNPSEASKKAALEGFWIYME